MTFFIHLLLAHFIADYPLQSGKLVALKMRGFLGVFLHTAIHLVSLLVLMSPLLHELRVWIGVAVIYLTHNLIDQIKVKLDKANPKYRRFLYFLDQSLHWSIITWVACYVGNPTPKLTGMWLDLYLNQTLWLYILTLVLFTYFYDVSRYFVELKMNKMKFRRDYKTMLINAVIVTVAFGLYRVL